MGVLIHLLELMTMSLNMHAAESDDRLWDAAVSWLPDMLGPMLCVQDLKDGGSMLSWHVRGVQSRSRRTLLWDSGSDRPSC
ncbi:uncharacterized protein C8A04DRAFT_23895 [Dichotomopilus funicola]|uniref:Secreted protein n=1 Tax=Dichotomopilus funicola TaxID=1934379 RepID=A0AAN6ZRD0_9PEZI|nr:hypothetical protein C8A04DRAFT_23895 [Dichotomopilus funicola]